MMNSTLSKKLCSSQLLRNVNKFTRREFADAKPTEVKVRTENPFVPPTSTLGK